MCSSNGRLKICRLFNTEPVPYDRIEKRKLYEYSPLDCGGRSHSVRHRWNYSQLKEINNRGHEHKES